MNSNKSNLRVAIGGIFQETSQFLTTQTNLDLWENTYIHKGPEVFQLFGTDCETAGILATCIKNNIQTVPLAVARCVSGGPNTDHCYQFLKNLLLSTLKEVYPVDGVLLSLHGSMTTISEDDPEGDILESVRQIVGPQVPVIATLDMHAHVTERMIQQANGLVAFSHYPHDDTFCTGKRAANLFLYSVQTNAKLTSAMAKVPVLVGGINGMTYGDAPMAKLTQYARQLEKTPPVLSASIFGVHPYNDLPDLGSGGLVITNNAPEDSRYLSTKLANEYWSLRYDLECEMKTVAEAIQIGKKINGGPVLLIDTADCTGGGASGDSVALLKEMLRIGVTDQSLLTVVDPEAVHFCSEAGIGKTVELLLGHKLDSRWGKPIEVEGTIERLIDGKFIYTGGLYGGTEASMGPSVVFRIGNLQVLIMSKPTYDWKCEQFEAAEMNIKSAKFIGVKNPMNFNFAYKKISKGALLVDTPGPTPASVKHLDYKRMKRPFFPLDRQIKDLKPTVLESINGNLNPK